MQFRLWLENKYEDFARKMAPDVFQQLKDLHLNSKYLPAISYFFAKGISINPREIQQIMQQYDELVNDKKLPMLQITRQGVFLNNQPTNFQQFSEKVHALHGEKHLVLKRGQNNAQPEHSKPIFHNDKVDIYLSNSMEACIQNGKGYSFCISQPGNTLYQSYRDLSSSTFYFVYDRTRDKSDPLHIVVVDATEMYNPRHSIRLTDANNRTGKIAQFGSDVQGYLGYLYSLGVPEGIFKNIKKTPEEVEETEKLHAQVKGLTWFKNLSPEHKSRYIGRGHELSDEQFDFIWDHNLASLINQYISTGNLHNKHQTQKILSNSQYKKTYVRAIESTDNVSVIKLGIMMNDFDYVEKHAQYSQARDEVACLAAEIGNLEMLKKIMGDSSRFNLDDVLDIIQSAAHGNHLDIIKYLYDKYDAPKADMRNLAGELHHRGHKDIASSILNLTTQRRYYQESTITKNSSGIGIIPPPEDRGDDGGSGDPDWEGETPNLIVSWMHKKDICYHNLLDVILNNLFNKDKDYESDNAYIKHADDSHDAGVDYRWFMNFDSHKFAKMRVEMQKIMADCNGLWMAIKVSTGWEQVPYFFNKFLNIFLRETQPEIRNEAKISAMHLLKTRTYRNGDTLDVVLAKEYSKKYNRDLKVLSKKLHGFCTVGDYTSIQASGVFEIKVGI